MKSLIRISLVLVSSALLVGCAVHGHGSYHHQHGHGHKYMSKDHHYYSHKGQHGRQHHHPNSVHKHRKGITSGGHYESGPNKSFYYPEARARKMSGYSIRQGAIIRMSKTDAYEVGYEAGCRSAKSGGMYKTPKLRSLSQYYQEGWHDGFKQCHYSKAHIDTEHSEYSFIPY